MCGLSFCDFYKTDIDLKKLLISYIKLILNPKDFVLLAPAKHLQKSKIPNSCQGFHFMTCHYYTASDKLVKVKSRIFM